MLIALVSRRNAGVVRQGDITSVRLAQGDHGLPVAMLSETERKNFVPVKWEDDVLENWMILQGYPVVSLPYAQREAVAGGTRVSLASTKRADMSRLQSNERVPGKIIDQALEATQLFEAGQIPGKGAVNNGGL